MRLVGKYTILFVALVLSCAFSLRAQEVPDSMHTSTTSQDISIYYDDNVAYPCWTNAGNAAAYKAIAEKVKCLSSKHANVIVIVEGAASPLGSEAYNFRLALQRAENLRDIILQMEGGAELNIRAISAGEDWDTFKSNIEKSYHEPNREEVLAILRAEVSNDEKEQQLKALERGGTWRKLVREFMALSRNSAVIHIVEIDDLTPKFQTPALASAVAPVESDVVSSVSDFKSNKNNEIIAEPIDTIPPTTIIEKAKSEVVQVAAPRKPVVAVRSNLLVPALNIGLEVPIGTNWSVGADYYFPWVWPKSDNKNCFEFLGWGVEGRYWFGKNRTVFDRLQGHSLGVYGYMGYYDFERNYQGHQGEFVNVGVDYTYAMAVGKKRAVHFEFSLGVGYIYSQARRYTVIESQGPLISDKITKRIRFFGPTKANISLVVPIFQKVKPNDKQRGNE